MNCARPWRLPRRATTIRSPAPKRRWSSSLPNSPHGCSRNASASKRRARTSRRQGFTERTHEALFRAAHDIKGEAATFGYPAAAGVAESLCRLLEHTPEIGRIPIALVDQHVDAVRAITREYARPDVADMASALTLRLREVTDDFLRQENDFRPDYLESIFSPPLAPGSAGT